MTPQATAQRLNRLLMHVPSEPPEAWSLLIRRVTVEAAFALERKDPFQVRDQALLHLAYTLSRGGQHASWRIAQAQPVGIVQIHWLACGRGHHEVYTTLHAGWERRQVPGSNRALPLEANQTPQTPSPVQTTPLAQSWLDRLMGDPLRLSVEAATLGLRAIPSGVWIAP